MTLQTIPVPGLFGGVSQQIPAMRHPTQCSEQLNGLATLVDGLYKRPGTEHVASLPLTDSGFSLVGTFGNAAAHVIDRGSSGRHQLIIKNGSLMLFDLATGAVQTVSAPNGLSYLAATDPENDFRCITVADTTFIVNRTVTVAALSSVTASNPANVAYIDVRQAVSNATYTVTVDNAIQAVTGTYSSQASWGPGEIAADLRGKLAAALPGWTILVLPNGNTIKIIKPSGSVTATGKTTWSNTELVAVHQGVSKFSDLPAQFETGYVVTVLGNSEEDRDDYYVQWDGKQWIECAKPGLQTSLDPSTLPHRLRPEGASWVFERVAEWDSRRVGDDQTNPLPSFVGRKLNGIFFHRNRLGLLAGPSVVLSRAGEYYAFFAKTATQVLDADPIDLDAPSENVNSLEWAVPYSSVLVVWDDLKSQFVLAGGDELLSPNNARLQPTTTYSSNKATKPVALGNRMLFAADSGTAARVFQYRVSMDRVSNTSEDLTEHCPSYVPASPRKLAENTTFKAVAVVPRGPSKSFTVFKYEEDGQEQLVQKAWQEFRFDTLDAVRIMDAHWVGSRLYLLAHVTAAGSSDPAGGRFHLSSLEFDRTKVDTAAGFGVRLDNRVSLSGGTFSGGNTSYQVPYLAAGQLQVLRLQAGLEPVVVTPVSVTNQGTFTQVVLAGDTRTQTLVAGRQFLFRYTFTPFVMRDRNSLPILEAVTRVKRVVVRYTGTGYFMAKVAHLLRSVYSYAFSGRAVGQPGQGATQVALSDGRFAIPVGVRSDASTVSIESDSYLPVNLPYAEWEVDVTMRARR